MNVTIDISKDADAIAAIQAKPGVAEDTAAGLYVLNTFARYLGALNYADSGATVSAIKYGDQTYTWKTKNGQTDGGYLKGSNWRQENLTTLVSVITSDVANLQETDTLTITLIDEAGHSVDVVFNVKTQE